jgi:hypothetical protein
MNKKPKIYLAYPYRHPDLAVMRLRFLGASELASRIVRCGDHILFSPLSHSRPIGHFLNNHTDDTFWLEQDLAFLRMCDELWIALVEGWCDSTGIARERAEAFKLNMPIRYVVPWGSNGYRLCSTQEMLASMEASRPTPREPEEDRGLPDVYP